ncbi:HAUS augmin-like complex subunit 7 [Sardina pilchardus]|uniref:HAUS augmin-like complex subunit 7 n=1 Tax=Sardina pilchardus TaxID=27697 RepID=UPI002E14E7F5
MAGGSKQQHAAVLSQEIYNSLQTLGCPLVEGLCLREAESIQELLCTPSVHRTDILKWICVSICPQLNAKLDVPRSKEGQTDVLVRFGHELMLCDLNDVDLIKGVAPLLRQLRFLEQLISLISGPIFNNSSITCPDSSAVSSDGPVLSGDPKGPKRSDRLLRELVSQSQLLQQLQSSTLSPLPSNVRCLLATAGKTSSAGGKQKFVPKKVTETELKEAAAQLQSTKNTLEELQKECEFLESGTSVPSSPPRQALSPCTLRVAATDLQQLMSTFGHIYYDFKGYCEKPLPKPPLNTDTFQTVHQLLQASNMELKAYEHLTDTSSSMNDTLTDLQTGKRFHTSGEMQSLTTMLESLKKKYSSFLSTHHDKQEE